jgi:putative membrane-bound dehydrogenase-like protein
MRHLALASILLPLAALVPLAGQPGSPEKPRPGTHTVTIGSHTFTLPVGFTIERVAGPPLVDRPIVADFDEDGRLYVADSSGSNDKVAEQLLKLPHRIVRLEDTDGDGTFDRSTVFADRMMFPEGVMWRDGSVYVAAPPSIWKLTDRDGKGVATTREEWFQGKTLTGCANDLHGPYAAPDGWIYWCKGAFARQVYKRQDKGEFITRAAHIFRCRPDGSGIEPVMTGGMDNPVHVVFTPSGERIFTTTFFQHPAGGLRDGLVHAIYGGIYGKDHSVIYDPAHRWTAPTLMPVLTHLGAAAPCGLVRFESSAFGKEYQDNLFAALFNMQKVTRHVLVPEGSTYRTRDEDFVVSDNRDFHPTHVLEDADGSLLIVDTGGWYKLCCPTSQLHKPDVLGAIYRVRRVGATRISDPRGRKLEWSKLSARDLAGLLDDDRPAVRRRAIAALAGKGVDALPVLNDVIRSGRSSEARRNAVWTATRIEHANARDVVRLALADHDESVRQVAGHSISLWRDREAVSALVKLLAGKSLPNRRVAAEALGRIGNRSAVPALLEAAGQPADRMLEHSLTYALIEIADREGTAKGLTSRQSRTRRTALVALDRMEGGKLEAATVARELSASGPSADGGAALKEATWWIAGRHPEWAGELTELFRGRLQSASLTPAQQEELVRQLAGFARTPAVQKMLADRLGSQEARGQEKRLILQAMAGAGLTPVPALWLDAVLETLRTTEPELLRMALQTARAFSAPKGNAERLTPRLVELATETRRPDEVRLIALSAIPGGLKEVKPEVFAFLRARLHREQPVLVRSLAVEVLVRAGLTKEQLLALTATLETTGPMELNRLLEAYTKSTDDAVGEKLLAGLRKSPVRSSLRVAGLKTHLAKYSPKIHKLAEGLYVELDADVVKQKAELEKLLTTLKPGDVRRGQAVFNSAKAACASCHAIGYLGGKVGPDLTRIGQIRSERDLLESILFPSASIVRSYEPVSVTTTAGKVYNGLVRKDTPEEVVLVLNATETVSIRRADIEEMQPSKVSIMPGGLDKVLTSQELADLVAFLRACK